MGRFAIIAVPLFLVVAAARADMAASSVAGARLLHAGGSQSLMGSALVGGSAATPCPAGFSDTDTSALIFPHAPCDSWSGRASAQDLGSLAPISAGSSDCGGLSDPRKRTVRELPPSPGSHRLAYSAAITLLAWSAARSARQLQLGALPGWFQDVGRGQMAHVSTHDLPFDLDVLPLCAFTVPTVGARRPWPPQARELTLRHRSQCHLASESPRGPPNLCSC
jgi:hypothetical protein